MADPYVGEIRPVGFNFAPREWGLCRGAIESINQNPTLFAIISTFYGGDGRTNFALPNLIGRSAMHWGTGIALTPRFLGERSGQYQVTLDESEMPAHKHTMYTRFIGPAADYTDDPAGAFLNKRGLTSAVVWNDLPPGSGQLTMSSESLGNTGGDQPHENRQPFLAVNFIIAMMGVFPSRN